MLLLGKIFKRSGQIGKAEMRKRSPSTDEVLKTKNSHLKDLKKKHIIRLWPKRSHPISHDQVVLSPYDHHPRTLISNVRSENLIIIYIQY